MAWEILQRVEAGAFADALLGRSSSAARLDPRNQGLLTALVYGTLTWQGYLDHVIELFSRRPPASLDPPVRCALRLGLFQIAKLSRVPAFAAVNSAVELVKAHKAGAAASFVNAVLRRAAREWESVALPDRGADLVGHLAALHSHPRWLVARWVGELGEADAEALLQANNLPAPTALRVNRRRIEPGALLERLREGGASAAATRYSPAGIEISGAGLPERVAGFEDGLFSVQGEASQLVGLLVAPRPGERVLDACAAPGGKATHLAELMDDRGEIVALDTNAKGVERMARTARRLGISIVHAAVADASRWSAGGAGPAASFDRVLVDAPCSGLGTLRSHPELKWRRSGEDIARLAALQTALLGNLAGRVRPGGVLVYATCTLTAEENERQVAAFLSAHPEFAADDPRRELPESVRPLVGEDLALRTWPQRHGLDGFFAVRLKRRSERDIVAP